MTQHGQSPLERGRKDRQPHIVSDLTWLLLASEASLSKQTCAEAHEQPGRASRPTPQWAGEGFGSPGPAAGHRAHGRGSSALPSPSHGPAAGAQPGCRQPLSFPCADCPLRATRRSSAPILSASRLLLAYVLIQRLPASSRPRKVPAWGQSSLWGAVPGTSTTKLGPSQGLRTTFGHGFTGRQKRFA